MYRQLRISLTKKSATGRGICEGRNRGKLQRVRSKIKVVLPRVVLFNEQSSNNCTRRRALYAKMYVITDGNTQCIEFMRCGNFNFSVHIHIWKGNKNYDTIVELKITFHSNPRDRTLFATSLTCTYTIVRNNIYLRDTVNGFVEDASRNK